MATPQGDGSIILTTAIDQSGLKKGIGNIKSMAKTATKAFLAVGAAAATATIAIAKASVDAFAEYEQLVGGVETLFKGSFKKLIEYANEAYKTAGVSANQYMSIVTSFSASLLQSLGGYTEKAADIANQALIDMSDNANKMGTSMEAIQNAYQGFAKQNYTMLDNLKLGYGGTKTEMERLLQDAQALTGVKYDISNLSDVYTAIHVIQENLGIAGTTALEAEKTISGSAATMKAAWQNVLTAISGGGDLDRAIENLVDSISNYFENIVPVVERALSGIGRLIEKVAPMLVQTVAKSLIKAIPSLLNAVYEMIIGLAKGIYQGIIDLFSGTSNEALTDQSEKIEQSVENQNDLTKAVEETNEAMEKTTASFDTVEILSAGIAQNASEEPIIPEISGGSLGENLEIEETEKELSKFEKTINKLVNKIRKYFEPLQNISLENLKNSFVNLTVALEPYKDLALDGLYWLWNDILIPMSAWVVEDVLPQYLSLVSEKLDLLRPTIDLIQDGLSWLWNDIIVPMGVWVVQDAVPAFIDMVAAAISALTPIIEAVEPTLSWLWDDILTPMASFVGDLFLDFLDSLTQAFTEFSDWASENSEDVEIMFDVLISGLAGLWVYNSTRKITTFISDLYLKFKQLGGLSGMMTALGTAINAPALAIAALVAAGLFWVQNWDKIKSAFEGMSGWQKTIVVVLGLAAAIAVLWVALSVGVAAATIVAGLALLGLGAGILAIGNANEKANASTTLSQIPSDSVVANAVPGKTINGYSIPGYARGTVVPPNRPHLAWFGDNTQEPEVVSPVSTMKQAFMEAMTEMGETGQTTKEEHYYLGETELMSIVYKLVKGGERLSGESLVSGGTY